MLGAVSVVALFVGWLVAAAVIPRWWSHRIGDVVDGRLVYGSLFGLVTGAVFTLVPLLVLALGWRLRRSVRRALVFVVLAVLLAAPNLATLGIVVGSGNAAHAGERTLDVDGPGFRGGSLVGAVIGVAAFIAVEWLLISRRRDRSRAQRLEADLAERRSDRG